MSYSVDCIACDFVEEIVDEVTAYCVARDHEAEHPDHFVVMERHA